MIIMYQLCSYDITGLLGDLIAENTLTTTVLGRKLLNRGALAHAIFRYNQKLFALGIHLHADNLIAII